MAEFLVLVVVLLTVCGSMLTLNIVLIRDLIRERREFAEQQRRDDEWDRAHGIGRDA
jgi:hypothetical protein